MGNKGAANRCKWVNLKNPAYIRYHDTEWGVPQHKDEVLFEMLFLEWFQAGLSWECILNKREGFRRAFDGFDAEKISRYEDGELARLLADPGIVRNRLKIRASIGNSRVFLKFSRNTAPLTHISGGLQQERRSWNATTCARPRLCLTGSRGT